MRIDRPLEPARSKTKSCQRADRPKRREQRCGGDREPQNLPAIGFEKDVLHVEGHGAEENDQQQPPGIAT